MRWHLRKQVEHMYNVKLSLGGHASNVDAEERTQKMASLAGQLMAPVYANLGCCPY